MPESPALVHIANVRPLPDPKFGLYLRTTWSGGDRPVRLEGDLRHVREGLPMDCGRDKDYTGYIGLYAPIDAKLKIVPS